MLNNNSFINTKFLTDKILSYIYQNKLDKNESDMLKSMIQKTRELILSSEKTLDELVNDFKDLTYFGVNFGYYILKQLEPSLSDNYNFKLHLKAIMKVMEMG
jgi:hypothetical protein